MPVLNVFKRGLFKLPVWLAKHEDMKRDPIVDVTDRDLADAFGRIY